MGERLGDWGVETCEGYDAAHLEPRPDLVIVGNVCRKDNVEARAAIDGGLSYVSMPGALEQLFLAERPSLRGGRHPRQDHHHRVGSAPLAGRGPRAGLPDWWRAARFPRELRARRKRRSLRDRGRRVRQRLLREAAQVLSLPPAGRHRDLGRARSHRHLPQHGQLPRGVRRASSSASPLPGCWWPTRATQRCARWLAPRAARCASTPLQGDDTGDVSPEWLAAPAAPEGGIQPFDLFFGGSACGRVRSPLSGHAQHSQCRGRHRAVRRGRRARVGRRAGAPPGQLRRRPSPARAGGRGGWRARLRRLRAPSDGGARDAARAARSDIPRGGCSRCSSRAAPPPRASCTNRPTPRRSTPRT